MKLACVFPGQGAQSINMMAGFAASQVARAVFGEAADVLGVDYWKLQESATAEELARTTITQPLLLTAGVAVYRHFVAEGGALPTILAGHSLGEYAALVAAESLTLSEALRLVKERARLMEEAAAHGVGGMAAILGAEEALIQEGCEAICKALNPQSVEPVNYNSPEQIVVAGHKMAVEKLCEWLKAKGVKRAIVLPVGGAFHSRLMDPASSAMRAVLEKATVSAPKIPVLQNADLAMHQDPAKIRESLARQVAAPVRWVDTMRKIAETGVLQAIEAAPGKILTGLNRRIVPQMTMQALVDEASVQSAIASLK